VLQLLITANIVPSFLIPSVLMMEAIDSSETSVLTSDLQYHIHEDGIINSHRREKLTAYNQTLIHLFAFDVIFFLSDYAIAWVNCKNVTGFKYPYEVHRNNLVAANCRKII
jgi:hypothetical protein